MGEDAVCQTIQTAYGNQCRGVCNQPCHGHLVCAHIPRPRTGHVRQSTGEPSSVQEQNVREANDE